MAKRGTIVDSPSLVVFCTCPDQAVAERLAAALVDERLAACVNLVAGITSIYRWEDQVQRDSECLLIIKTRQIIYPLLETRLQELHPYETPEIIALPIQAGAAPYLNWLAANTETSR